MTEPSGHGYDDSQAWRTETGMRKHEKNSRFDVPRFDKSDLAELASRRGYTLSDNRLARRAKASRCAKGCAGTPRTAGTPPS